jgi:putative two-component system response regulator
MDQHADDKLVVLEQKLASYAADLSDAVRGRQELEASYKLLSKQLVSYGEDFRKVYNELTEQLEKTKVAYLEIIHRLSLAAEFKDEETGDHIERMSRYSAIMAQVLGFTEEEVECILYAAPMHDVGKIGIPDRILLKPGALTKEELAEMSKHTTIGAKILENSDAEIIQLAQTIALNHHEKWNGEGYPNGLKGEEIPLVARIVNLADMFDAMTSKRPYKDPYPVDLAVQIITKDRGISIDPQVVDAFVSKLDAVLNVRGKASPYGLPGSRPFKLSERDVADGLDVNGITADGPGTKTAP